ncbi:MAG: hypothetical protein ACX94C_08305 [Phycisphaerales bacterium]
MQTQYRSVLAICTFFIASPFVVAGCNSPQLRPQRPFELSKVEATLDTDFDKLLMAYYNESTGSNERKSKRNELIDRAILVTDIKYYEFVESFSMFKKRKDTASEIGIAALSGTAAVIEPLGTSQILSAIAGGVSTSNIAFNKNYFYEQTTQVLISSMNARRLQVRTEILSRTQLSDNSYSMQAALADLERYYSAGTFEGALDVVAEKASTEKQQAEEEFKQRYRDALAEAEQRSSKYLKEKDALIVYMSTAEKMGEVIDQATNSINTFLKDQASPELRVRVVQSELYKLVVDREPAQPDAQAVADFLGDLYEVDPDSRFTPEELIEMGVGEIADADGLSMYVLQDYEGLVSVLKREFSPRNREVTADLVIIVRQLDKQVSAVTTPDAPADNTGGVGDNQPDLADTDGEAAGDEDPERDVFESDDPNAANTEDDE